MKDEPLWSDERIEDFVNAKYDACEYFEVLGAMQIMRDEYEAERAAPQAGAAAMPQPNWDEAPSWSNWWSVSADGHSWWHQTKPEEDATGFVGGWKGQYAGYVYPDWRLSLQPRPATGEPPHVG